MKELSGDATAGGPGSTGQGMPSLHMRFQRTSAAAAVGCALLLSACADGIDLNGKLFDTLGISSAAMDAKRTEPKLAERAPLVMPPDVNRLPEPGSGQAPMIAQQSWPDDPVERKAREAQERQRLHEAYCRGEVQWKEKVLNKEAVGAPRSPYGPCSALVGAVTNFNKE
jgi:hypothetical protein